MQTESTNASPDDETAFELYGDGSLPEDADLIAPNAKKAAPESDDDQSSAANTD